MVKVGVCTRDIAGAVLSILAFLFCRDSFALLLAVSTLLFVPAVFSVIHGMRQATSAEKQQ